VAAAQVGEAIKACAEKKPVIVSQGQLAASGGYWVSAHADRILAGPNTITGSIGVIGGWIYDDGFGDNTGLSSDVVQRGERADLFQGGLRLPLVGVSVPTRKLTDEELARVEDVIRQGYDEFVATVAEGRDTTEAHIRAVGEGRIYSGWDGKTVGLVDEIGGLPEAIERARAAAGLAPEEARVREVNPTVDFTLRSLLPGPLAGLFNAPPSEANARPTIQTDPAMTYLRLMLEHQPGPLVLLPPSAYPHAD
jgi:protease-4